jgi:hypothetical protein
MKNATPSEIAIKKIIDMVDDLINFATELVNSKKNYAVDLIDKNDTQGELHRKLDFIIKSIEQINTLGFLKENQFKAIKSNFYIKDEKVFEIVFPLISNSGNYKGHIEDIIDGEFTQSKDNLFLERMNNLRKALKNCLSKEEKTQGIIKGLKKPLNWEQVVMIFNGDTLKIKQNDKTIGEYTLEELGFPKIKTERTVTGLFYSLFVRENQPKNNLLLSTDNKNQKIKSNLSKILCNAFNINIDPISIDKYGFYKARFKTHLSGELYENRYASGGFLNENQEYED